MNAAVIARRVPPSEAFAPPSPNKKIDDLIDDLMKEAKNREKCPIDVAIKLVAQAVAWEKVKHHIKDRDEEFDPDDM